MGPQRVAQARKAPGNSNISKRFKLQHLAPGTEKEPLQRPDLQDVPYTLQKAREAQPSSLKRLRAIIPGAVYPPDRHVRAAVQGVVLREPDAIELPLLGGSGALQRLRKQRASRQPQPPYKAQKLGFVRGFRSRA